MARKRGRDVHEWERARVAAGELEALGEGAATDVGVGRRRGEDHWVRVPLCPREASEAGSSAQTWILAGGEEDGFVGIGGMECRRYEPVWAT